MRHPPADFPRHHEGECLQNAVPVANLTVSDRFLHTLSGELALLSCCIDNVTHDSIEYQPSLPIRVPLSCCFRSSPGHHYLLRGYPFVYSHSLFCCTFVMCGISCIQALHNQATQRQHDSKGLVQVNERDQLSRELERSLGQIKHRGPDASGQWISKDNRVGTLTGYLS